MKQRIYIIMTMLVFGSVGLFVKQIPLPSAQIALVRGVIGSTFLMEASFILNKKMSWKAIKPNIILLIASGAAIGFNWILLFEAYRYTTISIATLSYYFAPVFVVFLSPFILKERLNIIKIICILGAMAGMFLIVGTENGSSIDKRQIIGIGLGLSAAVLYASVVILNKFIKNLSGLETTFVQLASASVVLFFYVLFRQRIDLSVLTARSIVMLAIVGFIHTGLAYLVYFTCIKNLKSQTIAVFGYIDPISAIIMSALILGETMTGIQIIGAIIILGAAFISEMAKVSKKQINE